MDRSMEKLKQSCDSSFERDRAYGFSWPQRSYRCSFCSKEFMSAQALGGHMNVHRRDRARMRLYPSWDSPNPNPNPTPNPNPNPNPSFPIPFTSKFPPFSDVIDISPSLQEEDGRSSPHKIMALLTEDLGMKNEGPVLAFTTKNDLNARDFVRLDLNLALIPDLGTSSSGSGLDLELRLGCS